jgi:hypothetical protein
VSEYRLMKVVVLVLLVSKMYLFAITAFLDLNIQKRQAILLWLTKRCACCFVLYVGFKRSNALIDV